MVLMYMSSLYRVVLWKLHLAESKVTELTNLLENQTQQLMELIEAVDALREKSRDNERRAELQRHELKEQYITLRELYMALKMKTGENLIDCAHFLPSPTAGENSRRFWLLRKYHRNLVAAIKPCIDRVIKTSVDAGIVPELVVGESCTDVDEKCAVFYRALQVRVGESPQVLDAFLQLIQENFQDSKPCNYLRSKMLSELNVPGH